MLVAAMRLFHLCSLVLTCLSIHLHMTAGLVAVRRRSLGSFPNGRSPQNKRQPITPQGQPGLVQNVPVPGQQSQSITSTAGAGNGTIAEPGVITNGAIVAPIDGVDCNNITTGRDNKCWEELNLTQWVQQWIANNSCHTNEPFASCFMRLEGFPGLDCTGIKIDACTAPQGANVSKDPKVFYVAYNIYGKISNTGWL